VSDRFVRSQRAAVVELGDDVALVGRDGSVARLTGESAELAREVIAFVGVPRSRDDVIAHVERLAGPLGERNMGHRCMRRTRPHRGMRLALCDRSHRVDSGKALCGRCHRNLDGVSATQQ
jgi:hypothetical protein